MAAALVDSYGRKITYLRVSLTDACNFKCIYCVPPGGFTSIRRSCYLKREEVVRFVRLAGTVGIERVRLTGGEPLLRHDIVEIVRDIKKETTVKDLSMTTNGSRLQPFLKPLKTAGLDRINISLDSLEPERFQRVTLSNAYHEVLESTYRALEMGFPIKLNMVALRGLSVEEITRFVQLAYEYPLEVRFLEFMPLCGSGWSSGRVFPMADIRSIIRERFTLTEETDRKDQVARTFRVAGGKGRVGFIGSLTESFCDQCSRIRMTADGRIRPCLFSEVEVPVGHLLRQNAGDEEMIAALREAVRMKPAGNPFRSRPFKTRDQNSSKHDPVPSAVVMRSLGG